MVSDAEHPWCKCGEQRLRNGRGFIEGVTGIGHTVASCGIKLGVKKDDSKARWDLLPITSVRQIVAVLTFGASKYSDENWQQVPDAKRRYYAAAMRHLTAWWEGEKNDPESGLSHLAHCGACILFLLWFDEKS